MDIRQIGHKGMSTLLMQQLLNEMGEAHLVIRHHTDYSPYICNTETGEILTITVKLEIIGRQPSLEEALAG
jgi:hypothetical protein